MNKKIFLFIAIFAILVVVVGIFVFRKVSFERENKPDENAVQSSEEVSEGMVVTPATSTEQLPVFTDFEADQDRDGVDDVKEKEMGLSTSQFDTDGDGLSDANEIENYKTDPKNKDSDKDGYADGYEVLNGFDPNGPGQLPAQAQ